MLVLLMIAGAVALILFGVRFLRKGLDRLFGPRLGRWMRHLAHNRLRGFLAGFLVSVLTPSSTTMSLLAVETVKSGQLSPRQMLAVMLGANIGLTVIIQLFALQIETYAPLLILLGVALFQFSHGERFRGVGQVILSLGLIFLAIWLIKDQVRESVGNLTPESDLGRLLTIAEKYAFWLMVLSALVTLALQSSSATIGLLIGLTAADASLLTGLALPGVLGANIGLALTTLIAGWWESNARRMALANLLLKVVVALPLLLVLAPLSQWLDRLPGSPATHIAHAHTIFNIAVAVIGLPLVGPLSLLLERLFPNPPASAEQKFGPKYITSGPVDSVALALGQSTREIMRVSEIVRSMLDDLWLALDRDDDALVRQVVQRDDQVDLLDGAIKQFLIHLGNQSESVANSSEQIQQLSYLTELETVGDIIDKNLSELVAKKIRLGVSFSEVAQTDLNDFQRKVAQNLLIADTVFVGKDAMLAQQLLRHERYLVDHERQLRDRHFARLNAGSGESFESSAIFLDLLTQLKSINAHASHVALAVLRQGSQNISG